MPISQKELGKKKALAKLIIESEGGNFDDWQAQQYERLVDAHQDTIQKALACYNKQSPATKQSEPS